METNKKVFVITKPKIGKKKQRIIKQHYTNIIEVSLNKWISVNNGNKEEVDIIGYMLQELNNMKIKTETVFNICNCNEKELIFRCISEEGNIFYIRISEELILKLSEYLENKDILISNSDDFSGFDNNEIKYLKVTYNESFSYKIPVSLKIASLDEVGPSHNCVVYECSGGLCLVKRDKYLNCIERSYCFEGVNTDDSIYNDLSFLVVDGFYIFSVSFITRENNIINESIIKDIEYYSLKLKNLLYEKCMCLNENFIVKMRSLNKQGKYLSKLINTKLEEIYESINTLKKIKKEYIEIPPVTEEDIDNYNKVIYNLRIRQNMLVDIMGLYSSFIKDNSTIMLLNESLKNKIEYIEDTYTDIDMVKV